MVTNPLIIYIVLGLAIIFEGFALTYAVIEFRRQKGDSSYFYAVRHGKDPTTFVVLFEDSAAMLGLLVALFGVLLGQITGNQYYDGAASVVIGLILGATAIWLAYETKGLLIGESAENRVVQGIRDMLSHYSSIEHVNEVLTMHMGPSFILVNLSVDFADQVSLADVEGTIASIDKAIKTAYPNVKRVFIEAESSQSVS